MKIAVLQMNGGIDPAANTRQIVAAVADAAAQGAQILFTPEMSNLLDQDRRRAANAIADERSDPVLAALCAAAKAHGIYVQVGSLALSHADGKNRNRAFMIDRGGNITARYDKIHLFDAELGGDDNWRESNIYAGGDCAVIAKGAGAKIGLSICYDIRFPRLYQMLAHGGAEILSIPAAFTVPTGQAHWHVLLRARAIESSCFVVAAAQSGSHQDGRSTYGHSLVVDPWGKVLLDMENTIDLGFAEIDLADIGNIRRKLPSLANVREIRNCTSS